METVILRAVLAFVAFAFVDTSCTIGANAVRTFVDILLALLAFPLGSTIAMETAYCIDACAAILTEVLRLAFVYVNVTMTSRKP